MRILFRPSVVAKDTRKRPREQMIRDAIDHNFGAVPDIDERKDFMYVMVYGGVIGGFVVGAIGVGVGAVVQATVSRTVGTEVMKAFGVLGAAPLLALAMVWAVRAQFNDIDYRQWTKQGRPAGHVPSGLSQPKDRDLLAIVLLALLLAAFFWAA